MEGLAIGATGELPGHLVHERTVGGDFDGTVGEHRLDQLVLHQRALALHARLDMAGSGAPPRRRLRERAVGTNRGVGASCRYEACRDLEAGRDRLDHLAPRRELHLRRTDLGPAQHRGRLARPGFFSDVNGGPVRTPGALVFLSGRVAHPSITLTTWSECRFKINQVRAIDAQTIEVVGAEQTGRCDASVNRQRGTARLDHKLVRAFKEATALIVTSRSPEYSIEADLTVGLA